MILVMDEVVEFFRSLPPTVCVLMILPVIMISAPTVCANQDIPVFRMQQFDLNGAKLGSRSATVNLEARSLSAANLIRKCAVVKISDLSLEQLKDAIADGLSGLLILLPKNIDQQLPKETEAKYNQLEMGLLAEEIPIPIYFSQESDDTTNLYNEVAMAVNSDSANSALKALTTVALINSFHFVTDSPESKPLHDFPIVSFQGKLVGEGLEEQLPTVAVVAHYDAFSVAPALSKGSDSSASSVAAFFEIVRLFSKLYQNKQMQPKYNILFLLSGGGKFNFQGTKKWIDENLESSEISLLSEVEYVLCIDALGKGSELNLHVSKPPKEGSHGYQLFQEVSAVAKQLYPANKFNFVHKKINLAADLLAWEHEKFSLRRLPAGTFSHHSQPSKLARGSLFDRHIDEAALLRNVKIISEGLARYVFNLTGRGYPASLEVFSHGFSVDSDHVKAWMKHLTSQSRAQQLLTKDNSLLGAFEETLSKYLKDVQKFVTRADKKDPEFVFYDAYESKMNVYSVKPALFDLFLALGIAAYLGVIYLLVENFTFFSEIFPKAMQNGNTQSE